MNKEAKCVLLAVMKLPNCNTEFAIVNNGTKWIRPEKLHHPSNKGPRLCNLALFLPLPKALSLISAELRQANTRGWKYDYSKLCRLELGDRLGAETVFDTMLMHDFMTSIVVGFNIPKTVTMGWHEVVIRGGMIK